MKNDNQIIFELQQIAPMLTELQKTELYSLPLDYFSQLPQNIFTKLQEGNALLQSVTRSNAFAIPDNYFLSFPARVMAEIQKRNLVKELFDETEQIAPILNTLSKQPLYHVPEHYFEQTRILKKTDAVKENGPALRRLKVSMFRFAAAAILIGVVSMVFLFNWSRIENSVRSDYSQSHKDVQKLSEQEIISFLKTSSPTENLPSAIVSPASKNNDITISLSKIPDEEIKNFLRENGVEVEM